MSSLRVTYRAAADRVAGMQKYLDDIFEQMAAARMGNGQYRLCFAGGYLDDGSRLMYEIQEDAGRTLSRISRMDDLADPKVLKELGGAGHLDDVDDLIAAAKGLDDVNVPKGLDGIGGEIKVDNYVRVNEGGIKTSDVMDEVFDGNGSYSGRLEKVNNPDANADMLAERIGGESRVRFTNDPKGREFDAISNEYIAQAKPALSTLNKSVRDQMKATFEAARQTGKKVYYQFEGTPAQSVIDKLHEYSERYGIEVIIDINPLN